MRYVHLCRHKFDRGLNHNAHLASVCSLVNIITRLLPTISWSHALAVQIVSSLIELPIKYIVIFLATSEVYSDVHEGFPAHRRN